MALFLYTLKVYYCLVMTEYSSQEVISETKINSELKRIRTTARQLLFCAQYMTDKTVPENKKPRYNSNAEITQAFWEHKDDVYMHEYDRLGINLFHGTPPHERWQPADCSYYFI